MTEVNDTLYLIPHTHWEGAVFKTREQYLEIPAQACITKDNATISVDFFIYWKVVEASDSVIQVRNFAGASQGIGAGLVEAFHQKGYRVVVF